jgi:hypothetical protein
LQKDTKTRVKTFALQRKNGEVMTMVDVAPLQRFSLFRAIVGEFLCETGRALVQ